MKKKKKMRPRYKRNTQREKRKKNYSYCAGEKKTCIRKVKYATKRTRGRKGNGTGEGMRSKGKRRRGGYDYNGMNDLQVWRQNNTRNKFAKR